MSSILARSAEWFDSEVKSSNRQTIALIHDIVLNKSTGKIDFIILDLGGFLNFGEKFTAVPWNLFYYDTVEHCLMLNFTKNQLSQAPHFRVTHWPDESNPESWIKFTRYYD